MKSLSSLHAVGLALLPAIALGARSEDEATRPPSIVVVALGYAPGDD